MDSNNEDNVQNVDNAADHVVKECLRNSVVLEIIMEHISSPQLRQLSLVSKFWKSEAQSVLRKRGHLTAYVKTDYDEFDSRGEKVDDFIADLKQMNPVPFSGISIDLHFKRRFAPLPIATVDPLEGVVLNLPSLKTVSVKLEGFWWTNMHSPGFLLAKKLLQDCSTFLEELELWAQSGPENFIEKVVQDLTFPRLKILKLTDIHDKEDETDYENYMKTILSRAPNLKVLHSDCPINLTLNLLEGRSVVPVYTSRVVAPFEEISDDVIGAIKLEKMRLKYTGPEFNLDRFNRIAPMLLQKSCSTTLRYMHLDAVLALPLMSYGISLKNVKFLIIDIDQRHLEKSEPRLLSVFKGLDFTRIFPNLKKVVINNFLLPEHSPDHMNRIIEHATAGLREPMPDRAVNIKVLRLFSGYLSSVAVQFFLEMFPSIEELNISGGVPYEVIWKSRLDLKKLTVEGIWLGAAENLDSDFCGIFPEEVAELREKDEDYLMRVNIVPVMPAITCLKNLRALFVQRQHFRNDPLSADDVTSLFSKVTALIAFGRMPALAVTVNISVPGVSPAMTHLKPYMSVTHDGICVWRAQIQRSEAF